jgi:transmembrane sensor
LEVFVNQNLKMDQNLLERYFNNSCSNEELSRVVEWFKNSAKTQEGKELLFRLWEEMPDKEEEHLTNFDHILDKIHHDVNLIQAQDLLILSEENISKYRKKERFIMYLSKVAAIFLIPVLLFSIYISYKYHSSLHVQTNTSKAYNEVFSSVDAITKVALPDGSNVWLNHSSTLKFPATFEGDSRTVELKGEGYFEVAHHPDIPFVVKVGEINVVARGTTFNILAYPEEDRIETSLIKGKVDVQKRGSDGQIVPLIEMKPNDLAIYQKTIKKISTQTICDDRNFAWKEGKLIFNKAPMGDVVKRLSRWFNVDIQISDPKILELSYTATFKNETLPQVMELLSMVSPISYSISNRKEMGDGNFTKRKVTLKYKKK